MTTKARPATDVKPTDKYAQSDQAPPPEKRKSEEFISDVDAEDVVVDASEDSFPASDPPAYSGGDATEERRSDR